MGTGKSTLNEQPGAIKEHAGQGSTKEVSLLILHKNGQDPEQGNDHITDALNATLQSSSLTVCENEISIIPDSGVLPESVTTWVSQQLSQGRIVLVCLLSDFDVKANFENNRRMIVVYFQNPPVNDPGDKDVPYTYVDVDFFKAKPGKFREKMEKGLVGIIKAGGHN
jgi:hypothetical protein